MEKAKEIPLLFANKVHRDQLVTLGDLQQFKDDLLSSIKFIIQVYTPHSVKKWLKSYEVKKLMNISTGTLQNLRSNGTLPYTKIGGSIYYDAGLINQILAGQKKDVQASGSKIHKKH